MTREQRDYALACLDAYAEIFGPRLGRGDLYDPGADACCATGALGLFKGDPTAPHGVYGMLPVAFGLDVSEVWVANDDLNESDETPEQRFTRMRKWFASHPVTD